MNQKTLFIKKHKTLFLLSILTISIFFIVFPLNLNDRDFFQEAGNDSESTNEDFQNLNELTEKKDIIASSSSSTDWWDSNWQFRLPINISSSGDFNYYQVLFNINLTNFYNSGYINETGKDIRFVNVSNSELNYWIEKMDVSGGNSTIWVKIPDIKKTGTRIYMYFGNPNAISASNAVNTFDLYDGFEGPNLDSKWRATTSGYVFNDGKLRINTGGITLEDPLDFKIQDNYMVEAKVRFEELASGYSGTIPEITSGTYTSSPGFTRGSNANSDSTILYMRQTGSRDIYYWAGDGSTSSYNLGSGSVASPTWTSNEDEWYLTGISVVGGTQESTAKMWRNGSDIRTFSGVTWYKDLKYASLGYFAGGSSNGQDTSYDWVRIRRYNTTEPTMSQIGVVESLEYEITCLDVDGRIVPDAHVFISNETRPYLNKDDFTNVNGTVSFFNVSRDKFYNITVHYNTSNNLHSKTVYYLENYKIPFSSTELTLYVNLWTIDFEVIDWDNKTMDDGFVYLEVYNNTARAQQIDNITFTSGTGKATFRWINRSQYVYDIYYRNEDYFQKDTLINTSTIIRREKSRSDQFDVNKTNTRTLDDPRFHVDQTIYAEGSDETTIGHIRLINATIRLDKMNDTLTEVDISYIDADGVKQEIYEASKTYSGTVTQDIIELDNLEKYDAYGLNIVVKGTNSSKWCNGTIDISGMETTSKFIRANMSKMNIKIMDGDFEVVGAIVKISNSSNGQSIVNLTTSSGEVYGQKGYAYGIINKIPFWYLVGLNYNISIDIGTQKNVAFNGTKTTYKFMLNQTFNLTITLTDTDKYKTKLTVLSSDASITWKNNMSYEVNFSYTDTYTEFDVGEDDPNTWLGVNDPTSVLCSVYIWGVTPTLLYQEEMHNDGDGIYTSELNSSKFSAGYSGMNYVVKIEGELRGFSPTDTFIPITINTKPTTISVHNYPSLSIKTTNNVSQYYNELINITVSYREVGQTTGLASANLTYSWQFGTGQMISGPSAGYFYYQLDTSTVGNVGNYLLSVTGRYENRSQTTITIGVEVLTRSTKINGTTKSLHNSTSIWVGNGFIVEYEYKDIRSGARIGDADGAYYYWSELDESGQPIELSKNINLKKTSKNKYELDFNASGRAVGKYALYIFFEKSNYEGRSAIVNLEIKERIFSASLNLNNGTGTTVSVVKGQPVIISLTLTDLTRGSASSSSLITQAATPLSGATVTLYITELSRSFILTEEGSTGVYELTIDTSDPDYQAFFIPQTLTGNFTIEKKNYETQTLPFTLVVGMEEIFTGFPMFYFILLVVGISAVVGSLGAYRYIQIAKIPKFVKDVRKIKKTIRSGDDIPESLLYPSKKEIMAEMVGDKWRDIGLSMEQILGIQSKKGKSLPDIKNENIEGGAA